MAVDMSQYERGRRQVNDQWGASQAANEFGRFTSQQRFNRQSSDYNRDFGRQQPGFMNTFAKRGLTGGGVQSGAFTQALQRRAGDFAQNVGRMNDDHATDMRRFDMEAANMDQYRTNALADIEAAKTKDIAMTALNIQALKPLFG